MVVCPSTFSETGQPHCPASYACVTPAQWNRRPASRQGVEELLNWLRELTTAVQDLNEHYWQREDTAKYESIIALLQTKDTPKGAK